MGGGTPKKTDKLFKPHLDGLLCPNGAFLIRDESRNRKKSALEKQAGLICLLNY